MQVMEALCGLKTFLILLRLRALQGFTGRYRALTASVTGRDRTLQSLTSQRRRALQNVAERYRALQSVTASQSVTGRYRAIQDVTGRYRALQGVAGRYRSALECITRRYKLALQGVTGFHKASPWALQGVTSTLHALHGLRIASISCFLRWCNWRCGRGACGSAWWSERDHCGDGRGRRPRSRPHLGTQG